MGEGLAHEVNSYKCSIAVRITRGRPGGIRDGVLRRHDLQGPAVACVGGLMGNCNRLESDLDSSSCPSERDVDGSGGSLVCSREVYCHFVALNTNGHFDSSGFILNDPIVIEAAFSAPLAVRHLCDHSPHQCLRLVEDPLHGLSNCVCTVFVTERQIAVASGRG